MKSNTELLSLARALRGTVLTLMLVAVPLAEAATLWTGPTMGFNQATNSTDVLIPGQVSLTRGFNRWLYNPLGGDVGPVSGTPSNTEWAFGSLANFNTLTYRSFTQHRALAGGDMSSYLTPNKPMVVHLISQDIYLSVTFTAWPHGGGPFAYVRSTPAPSLPTPTVTITNPIAGAVFAAPANVKIEASATVSSGSVTNVAVLANGTPVGSDQTFPFNITTSGLGAGNYALTAVATAAGVSSTSSVVNITVVAPVTVSISSPNVANGEFSFSYSANPGLRYVVQRSSDLVNWVPVVTNVAAGNPVPFTDTFISNGSRYYRVGRLPNP